MNGPKLGLTLVVTLAAPMYAQTTPNCVYQNGAYVPPSGATSCIAPRGNNSNSEGPCHAYRQHIRGALQAASVSSATYQLLQALESSVPASDADCSALDTQFQSLNLPASTTAPDQMQASQNILTQLKDLATLPTQAPAN